MSLKFAARSLLFAATFGLVAVGCSKSLESSHPDETFKEQNFRDTASNMFQSAMTDLTTDAEAVTPRANPIAILGACTYPGSRAACTNASATINWNGCTAGDVEVTGVIRETYLGPGAEVCTLNGDGSQVSRKIDATNPRQLRFSNDAIITSDMEPGQGFDGTQFPDAPLGTTITRLQSGSSNAQNCTGAIPCHHIQVHGVQNTMRGPFGGLWFDHVVTSDVTATGSRTQGSLTVTGRATVWNQIGNFKGDYAFNSIKWADAKCCFPTQGTISATVTGSVGGNLTMNFSGGACGRPTLTDIDGSVVTVELNQCQP